MGSNRWSRLTAVALTFVGAMGAFLGASAPASAATIPIYAYAGGTKTAGTCPIASTPSTQCSLQHALALATPLGATSRTIDLATPGVHVATVGDASHYTGNWTISLAHTTSADPLVIQALPGLSAAPVLDGNGGATGAPCQTPVGAPDCSDAILAVSDSANGTGHLTITGITFANANNTATGDGGGINNGDSGPGGSITIASTMFTNLTASSDGGAIDNADNVAGTGSITITGSTFTSNSAGYDGGAIDSGDNGGVGGLSVTGSHFNSNTAVGDGGAINNADNGGVGNGATIANSTFSQDVATGLDGGAIDNADNLGTGSMAVTGSTFSSNTAAYDGGAIDNADNGGTNGSGALTVTGSTFTSNGATFDGGAIDSADNGGAGTLGVTQSTFGSNTAGYDGGAIDNADAAGTGNGVSVTTSSFTSNVASVDGGAIDNADSGGTGTGMSVTSSTFASNVATVDGGAIDNADAGGIGTGMTITGSTFSTNAASTNDGGAIDNADYGGTATLAVATSTFSANAASSDGGAIDNADNPPTTSPFGSGTLSVSKSTLVANTASIDGGAIDNADSAGVGTATVNTSTFSTNAAGSDGGAIDNADNALATGTVGSGTLTVVASTLSGNTAAAASGPAIANEIISAPGVGSVTVASDQFGDACVPSTGTWIDAGWNVGDATCLNAGPGDVADATLASVIAPLANNGGPTQTMLPLSGNPGIGLLANPTTASIGGTTRTLCATTDQRGTASTTGAACYAGAVQGPPNKLVITSAALSVPASSSATGAITVTVEDHYGVPVDVQGSTTVHLSSSSANGTFAATSGGPSASTIVIAAGTSAATTYYGDRTVGTPTVTASATGVVSGSQVEHITPGVATHLSVVGPATATSGVPATVSVTAKDAFGNTATSYTGTVRLTSTDPSAVLPAPYQFVAGNLGVHAFSVTFGSGSTRTVTATDTVVSSITGTSGTITVAATPPPPPPPPAHGYWLVGGDGGIFTFGAAQFHGSTGNISLQRPVVGITPTADRNGYWLVATDGGIFAFGNASFHGSIPGIGLAPAGTVGASSKLAAPIVAMVPSNDGGGYFMVGADGGVFAFGDAKFAGSCPAIGGCSGAAVAVMPDATGQGYWLVTALGSVYAFGDAANYGSPGTQGSVVTSAQRAPDGKGYWILFANGTVTAFGSAIGRGGPTGSVSAANPATAIFSTADNGGYWVAAAGGAVFTYGNAPFDGDMSSAHLNSPIIAASGW